MHLSWPWQSWQSSSSEPDSKQQQSNDLKMWREGCFSASQSGSRGSVPKWPEVVIQKATWGSAVLGLPQHASVLAPASEIPSKSRECQTEERLFFPSFIGWGSNLLCGNSTQKEISTKRPRGACCLLLKFFSSFGGVIYLFGGLGCLIVEILYSCYVW